MDEQEDQSHTLKQASAEFEYGLRNCQALVEDFRWKLACNANEPLGQNFEEFGRDSLVG